MKRIRAVICVLMMALIPGLSVSGNDLPAEKVERVRTGMTIFGAILGLGIGSVLNPSPPGIPLSSALRIVIPVAATAAATGALASRWIAEVILARRPSILLSPFLGAGLGAAGSAVVGAISLHSRLRSPSPLSKHQRAGGGALTTPRRSEWAFSPEASGAGYWGFHSEHYRYLSSHFTWVSRG